MSKNNKYAPFFMFSLYHKSLLALVVNVDFKRRKYRKESFQKEEKKRNVYMEITIVNIYTRFGFKLIFV